MQNTKLKVKLTAMVVACGLTMQGCGLDKVEIPESLFGPSELGISIELHAIPDIVVADGIQTSVIRAIVRDQNGRPAAGREIVFQIADESGRTAEIGTLTSSTGARVYGSTSVTTNAQGITQVVYTTPERRDLTADLRLVIFARPVGTDASGRSYTSVRLDVKSAEPRRFPQIPGNASPTCSFNRAPNNPSSPAGTVLRLSSTASDADGFIVRYEWYFGDGTSATGAEGLIDVQKGYPFPGNYTITHIVTDNGGAQAICTQPVIIN